MKKSISVLILISLALSLVACSGSGTDIPSGMQLASNGDVAFEFFVPGGWITTEQNGIFGAYYSSSDKSSVSVSSLYPDNGLLSISDYWTTLEESYSETFKNFVLVEEPDNGEPNIVLGGKAAFKYVFTADVDGVSYKFMQILTLHDSLFYTLLYTATAENYDLHLEDINKTVADFRFK